ncbi:Sec-independent protein translocase protein TatB [Octadecabacter sp. G9-8]|uniref:Sec-independent protein translocase protein TatB n=1 Tax=Octadecabacter dasysiphoniae TaxID=2909341 RepID=A0ABS9CYL6_9RHOB|nr:Sec-independent protein translocase protein TatB [Octadecabacter dasysiphoniae]MCF2872147.1 Sec-independent protein translocase protein TatB [Octadecabacter dasysiphoniae]
MPNLSWMEMLVVGIVALIVIGPKDLPGLFRQVGQFVGKAKGMAREFSSAMNAAADEAGVSEINKTIKAAANPQKFGVDKIREASGMSSPKSGGETEALKSKLSAERAANKEKIDKAMAHAAETRVAAEKAEAAPKVPAKKAPAKKAAPKAAAAKPASKAAAAKPTAKKTPAKKPAAKKAAPKRAAKDAK